MWYTLATEVHRYSQLASSKKWPVSLIRLQFAVKELLTIGMSCAAHHGHAASSLDIERSASQSGGLWPRDGHTVTRYQCWHCSNMRCDFGLLITNNKQSSHHSQWHHGQWHQLYSRRPSHCLSVCRPRRRWVGCARPSRAPTSAGQTRSTPHQAGSRSCCAFTGSQSHSVQQLCTPRDDHCKLGGACHCTRTLAGCPRHRPLPSSHACAHHHFSFFWGCVATSIIV
jgi:hypothetical protein